MPIQPSPMAETWRPLRPSSRVCIFDPFDLNSLCDQVASVPGAAHGRCSGGTDAQALAGAQSWRRDQVYDQVRHALAGDRRPWVRERFALARGAVGDLVPVVKPSGPDHRVIEFIVP